MSIFYILTVIYFEIIYKCLTKTPFKSLLGAFYYWIFLGIIFSIPSYLLKDKASKIYTYIITILLSVIYSTATVLKRLYDMSLSFDAIGLSDQVLDATFIGETLRIIFHNSATIIVLFIPLIVFVVLTKKDLLTTKTLNLKKSLVVCAVAVLLFATTITTNADLNYLYLKKQNATSNIANFGVMPSLLIELRKKITGFEEVIEIEAIEDEEMIEETVYDPQIMNIDFDSLKETTTNTQIQTMDEYFSTESYTYKNEYTGILEGKNLIFIMAESFDGFFVDEELTPTLYKLIHEGLYFENYYSPTNLSTIGGEFALLTGLYQSLNELSSKWRRGTNEYPFGLATVFENLGYTTYAYHNNTYDYQDRNVYLKSIGFDNYVGCGNGLENKGVNCLYFPASDDEMMKYTVDDYINDDQFVVYYATVSGHMSWQFVKNKMAIKNKSVVEDLDYIETVKAYIAANLELEYGLTDLIASLEEAGKLEDTVIVLAADHHPYGFREVSGYTEHELMSNLAGYEIEDTFETFANDLIIYNPTLNNTTITKVCSTVDVLPTVYNLFGIEYDSRLFTGRDILSSSSGLVLFAENNWLTDIGSYDANTRTFKTDLMMSEEDEKDYIDRINKIADNRKLMAKYIMSNNYYAHVFSEVVTDNESIEDTE